MKTTDKFVVGAKCKVLLPVYWVGATVIDGSSNVWLPAVITKISYSKTGKYDMPAIFLNVRASHKYKTQRIENLMVLPSQIESTIKIK